MFRKQLDMDPQSLHIKTWKELLKGFERVKSYVVFSHGTVVIFEVDQNGKDDAISKAVDIMEALDEKNTEGASALKYKGTAIHFRLHTVTT